MEYRKLKKASKLISLEIVLSISGCEEKGTLELTQKLLLTEIFLIFPKTPGKKIFTCHVRVQIDTGLPARYKITARNITDT